MKIHLFVLFASLAATAVVLADEWDEALNDVSVKASAEQTLKLEIEELRKDGWRYAFQPPPEGSAVGYMHELDLSSFGNWKYNPKNDCIESKGGEGANVRLKLNAPQAGMMFLWFRYRDVKRQVNYTGNGALLVRFYQEGKEIGTWKLPRTNSPLCDRNGWRKYGVQDLSLGWPVSVWQDTAVVVPKAGAFEAELSVVEGGNYAIHAWVTTPDPLYEPTLEDFYPLWLRLTSLPEETKSFRAHLYKGVYNHAPTICTMTNDVPPGGTSGWFYAPRFVGENRVLECTLNDGSKGAQARFARLELSRTRNDSDIFFSEELTGHGNRFVLQFTKGPWDAKPGEPMPLQSTVTESVKSLEQTLALSDQKGSRPKRFRFELPLSLGVESYDAYVNEMKVSLLLGCAVQPGFYGMDTSNDPKLDELRRQFLPVKTYRSPMPFGYYENGYDKCLCSVREKEIAAFAKKTYEGTTAPGFSMWWDEPGGHRHRDCYIPCTKAYRRYAQEMNLKPSDLGVKDWEHVFPVSSANPDAQKKEMDDLAEKFRHASENVPDASMDDDGDDMSLDEDPTAGDYAAAKAPERYYWSCRYHLTKLRRLSAFATAEVEKYNPAVQGTACLSPDIVDYYDGIRNGTDWFDFFEHRGYNLATSEDWFNVSGDFAVGGFMVDFLRGCVRRQNLPVRMATVMCGGRTPWQVAAKAFTEIGHGAKDIWFYGYGPFYARMDESSSHVPGMRAAVKSITFPVGAVEDALLDGTPDASPIALLYSLSSDIRAHADGKPGRIGADRIWTDLLLTHLGRNVDIINEDGIFDQLKDYRFLWCGEDAVRRACLKPLTDWVSAGGTLFLTDGALTTDEFGRPLGFDTADGKRGKGCVIRVARAGNAYRKGRTGSKAARGFSTYPENLRNEYAEILDRAGVPLSVQSSVPQVEAHLYHGKDYDALVVANWTGVPQDVTLTFSGKYRSAEAFNSATALGKAGSKGAYVVELKGLPAGDCVRLTK